MGKKLCTKLEDRPFFVAVATSFSESTVKESWKNGEKSQFCVSKWLHNDFLRQNMKSAFQNYSNFSPIGLKLKVAIFQGRDTTKTSITSIETLSVVLSNL